MFTVKGLTIKNSTRQRLIENKKDKSHSEFIDDCLDKLGIPKAKERS